MTLSSKVGLHVEEMGTGVPALLLHSSGLSGRQWRRLVPSLVERGLRAVVPDLTGHGASEAWPEPRPFTFHADVERTCELLGAVGPAHVVGHSYGGLIALHAARTAPQSVRSLVLFDPVAFGTLDPVADAAVCADLDAVDVPWSSRVEDRERWLTTFVDYWGGKGAWGALREEVRAEFRRVGWVVREGVRSLVEDTTRADQYRSFRFPVRVLNGGRSPVAAGRVAQRLAEAMTDASVVTVPNIGHLGPVTHAKLVNPLIVEAILPRVP
jgi:pimeloyl-ACP methyl ester carboxylesterase